MKELMYITRKDNLRVIAVIMATEDEAVELTNNLQNLYMWGNMAEDFDTYDDINAASLSMWSHIGRVR